MHTLGMVLLWLAVIYFALQAVWIIIQLVVFGGMGLGGAAWMAWGWLRRHPGVMVSALAALLIGLGVLLG